ncbi:hypothetical protein P3X46_021578 [Hevea brasiliensis]|uniref:TMEM205-like domain-containing protein n=1 Tax=Hevea brasiliensis TaxID=3981 RepID=A0ABQ9LG18_HEVBR|nr:hypothetical protein P3X46_021578 [Hevea brasiliensis]
MMNLLALSLVFSSLFTAQVWSPSPASGKHYHNQKEEDVIIKEGHRVIVVETYDEDGQHNTKFSISLPQDPIAQPIMTKKVKQAAHVLPNVGQGLSGSYPDAKSSDGQVPGVPAIHKAQDVKETARESLDKAKETGKTIGMEAARNVSEKVDKVKESTGQAKSSVSEFLSHMGSPEGLDSLMAVVSLLGFATAYGMCMWHQFGIVQSKIYPVYFRALAYCIGAALLGHVLGQRKKVFTSKAEKFQVYNLLASILMVLINTLYLEPLATKAMFEKLKIEKEEGRGREIPRGEGNRRAEAQPVTAAAPNERLKKLNSYSSLLNIVTLMALSWRLVYLGQNLHGTC